MRFVLVALAALASAAPALADKQPPQPLSPEVVPGAGMSGVAGVRAARLRVVHAFGTVAAGTFRIDFRAGPGGKIVLRRGSTPVFRSVRFTSMRWAEHSVLIQGIGLAGGVRVRFTALAVDGARDVFRVSWQHRAALGGTLSSGAVVIH